MSRTFHVSQQQSLPIGPGGTKVVVKTEIKQEPPENNMEEDLESRLTEEKEADDQANTLSTEVNRPSFIIDSSRCGLWWWQGTLYCIDVFIDTLDIRAVVPG